MIDVSELEKKKLELLQAELKLEKLKMFSYDEEDELLDKRFEALRTGDRAAHGAYVKQISMIETKMANEEIELLEKRIQYARDEQKVIEDETLAKLERVGEPLVKWAVQLSEKIKNEQALRQLKKERDEAKKEAVELKKEADILSKNWIKANRQLNDCLDTSSRELLILKMNQDEELERKDAQLRELEEELRMTVEQTMVEAIQWDCIRKDENREVEKLEKAIAACTLDQ